MVNKFLDVYKPIFDNVATAIRAKKSIKTVIIGEQFTYSGFPKAVVNALPSPFSPSAFAGRLEMQVNFSVVLTILDHEPRDWFTDIIPVMADVVDAVMADQTLGGVCRCVYPTSFAPGEIKFKEKTLFGGQVGFAVFKSFTVT